MGIERRRSRMIDRKLQGSLVLRALFQWSFLVVATFFVVFCWEVLVGDVHQSLSAHLQQTWARYGPCFIVLFVLQPVAAYDSIKTSNRLAGPLLRFSRAIQQLVDGETADPICLRQGDFCQELATSFNRVLSRIQHESPDGGQAGQESSASDLAVSGAHSLE